MSGPVLLELRYELNRRQRLRPHLALWLPYLPAITFCMVLPPVLIHLSLWWIPVALLVVCVAWLAFKGFFVGWFDIVANPVRPMDVVIADNRLGYMDMGERKWLALNGVIDFNQINSDMWTLWHDSGVVIHIPAAVISEAQVKMLRFTIRASRTPVGVQPLSA